MKPGAWDPIPDNGSEAQAAGGGVALGSFASLQKDTQGRDTVFAGHYYEMICCLELLQPSYKHRGPSVRNESKDREDG